MNQVNKTSPNVVVLFPDQLRALSLPLFGEQQIETPNIDRLAADSLVLENAISNCPVCTPARAMLLTGRYPQTTGHLINTTRTRHSEISIGDTFARAGYKTAWVGKWHLHTGLWPALDRMPQHPDWVPEGRDRLGFEFWRAYNQHMVFFDGFVHKDDWNYERWEGYETDGLLNYGFEFMNSVGDAPFLLFLSPHPPHYTPFKFAPDHCYERLPKTLYLPANVPQQLQSASLDMYRHYLAMILAVDEMLGRLLDYLEQKGLAGIPVPRSIEGTDLSGQWADTATDHSAFIMNFSKWFDWFQDGAEWRGVRTQQYTYAKWLSGKTELYDLYEDPLQMHNLAGQVGALEPQLHEMLQVHQRQRRDELVPCTDWKHWLDEQRRVVRNAHGPLSHPESEPDWSLLH